jgi:hypothetical protein
MTGELNIMTDITSNQDYFYHIIEINNTNVFAGDEDYIINMPPAMGHNFKYNEMCFDIKISDDFTGNVSFTFSQVFEDSSSTQYDVPVSISQLHDIINITSQLNESNSGQTWKLLESSIKKLKIKFTQSAPGSGMIFLIIRASI